MTVEVKEAPDIMFLENVQNFGTDVHFIRKISASSQKVKDSFFCSQIFPKLINARFLGMTEIGFDHNYTNFFL